MLFVCFKETSSRKIWYLVGFKPLYQLYSSLEINLKYYAPLLAILTGRKSSFPESPHLPIHTLGKTDSCCILFVKTGIQMVSDMIYQPVTAEAQGQAALYWNRAGATERGSIHKENLTGGQIPQGQQQPTACPPAPTQCLTPHALGDTSSLPLAAKQVSLSMSLSLRFRNWSNTGQVIYAVWIWNYSLLLNHLF